MDLLRRFNEYISGENLFQPKDRLLLAVSGGMDSVVLLHLCLASGYSITAAHCNFKLRGEESERDEKFMIAICEKYGVPLLLNRFDTVDYAERNKVSIQVAARELRYDWFEKLLKTGAADFLLTAHHLSDNVETSLMNYIKGTGIAGLRGMLPAHNSIIRPLLFASKNELAAYAKDNKLSWVEDSSNESDKYSRNFLRHQVMPAIQKIFPAAESNIAGSLHRFREIEIIYRQAIDAYKQKLIEYKGEELHIPVLKLSACNPLPTILYEIVKPYGFHAAQVTDILSLLKSETGRYVASATYRIFRHRRWLIIAPQKPLQPENILVEESDKQIVLPGAELTIERLNVKPLSVETNSTVALIDAHEIKFPLLLRRWKQGDYFYPLGMRKKKKLARFFIDQKLSKTEKENIWVIECNHKIIWVVGYRIDDRFKVQEKTEHLLQFVLNRTGSH